MEIIVIIIIVYVIKCLVKNSKGQQPNPKSKPVIKTQSSYTYAKPATPKQQTAGIDTKPDTQKKQPENEILARANRNVKEQQEEKQAETQEALKERLQQKYKIPATPKQTDINDQIVVPVNREETVLHTDKTEQIAGRELADLQNPPSSELMKEIADLMAKGYDGNLTFSRDFVAEGIEMLNQIQM